MGLSKDKTALNLYQLASMLAGVGAQFGDPRQQIMSQQLLDSAQGSIQAQATKIESKKMDKKRGDLGDTLIGGVTGAAAGFVTGGPVGAVAGGVSGAYGGYKSPGTSQMQPGAMVGSIAGQLAGYNPMAAPKPLDSNTQAMLGPSLRPPSPFMQRVKSIFSGNSFQDRAGGVYTTLWQ